MSDPWYVRYTSEPPTAVPAPRSTPGPSTGTQDPSQAASEACGGLDGATQPPPEYAWPATPGEFAALWNEADDDRRARMVARLVENGEAAVRCFWLNHDGAVAELRHLGGEVARLREALEQVRALWCPLCGASPAGSEPECSWCGRLAAVLASVDAPAPESVTPAAALAEIGDMWDRSTSRGIPFLTDSANVPRMRELLAAVSPVPAPDCAGVRRCPRCGHDTTNPAPLACKPCEAVLREKGALR